MITKQIYKYILPDLKNNFKVIGWGGTQLWDRIITNWVGCLPIGKVIGVRWDTIQIIITNSLNINLKQSSTILKNYN